ncbi:hypothetical protein TKK_0013144 [Trichogramma kaykai]|uniref:CCAAT-binding factor domain-containing protein n=1 Tax=Trichogramma kaykai TaxID=54128 RepID=A0ABD2WJQ3_9HYME
MKGDAAPFYADDQTSVKPKLWYEEYQKSEFPYKHGKSDMEIIDLHKEAKKCLDSESTAYHLKQSKSRDSDYSYLKTALTKGTTQDKVAAGIVLVQNSPKHNLTQLNSLIGNVKVAKHNQCAIVIRALKDLFLNDLLHPHYKLLKFEEQELSLIDTYNKSFEVDKDGNITNRPLISKNKLLALWHFEDQLKEAYEKFIAALQTFANDTVDKNREQAISVMSELLMGNSEQRDKLLSILINKVGDPGSKVASKAVFCLTKLCRKLPDMKIVVLHEVEKLLFRPNIAPRAQYFAICLLTQFLLKPEDTEVATILIEVYFAFFKACLKKGEPDSRMMAAILSGVNRAYRHADNSSEKLNEHINSVYKVVHIGSFNVSLNALCLLFQVTGKDPKLSGRFYSAFYKKLLDPAIGTAAKKSVFLNLLYRVMRNDESIPRIQAFIKRILQVSLHFSANMICAILYVISQTLKAKKLTKNSLFKLKKTVKKENEIVLDDTVDKDEVQEVENNQETEEAEESIMLSNVICEPVENKTDEVKPETEVDVKPEIRATHYDPMARNPLHCGVEFTFFCELLALKQHFHPSVALFAKTILEGNTINYTGDPLEDLTLIRFLDRYVFKNPKKLEEKKVSRKNDPLAMRSGYTPTGIRTLPVGCPAYLNERNDRIPVDEQYLHKYLNERKQFKGLKMKKEDDVENDDDDDDDNSSVNSDDFNAMLDEMASKGKKSDDLDDLDFASDYKPARKGAKGKSDESEDEDDDDGGDSEAEDDDDVDEDDELLSGDSDMDELYDGQQQASDDEAEAGAFKGMNLDDLGSDDEMGSLDDLNLDELDDDFSDMEFNDDDEEEESGKRKKHGNKKAAKKMKGSGDSEFVDAEEFAEMLEQQGQKKFKYGASRSLSDRDGASAGQLDWETARNQKLQGYGRKGPRKGGKKPGFKPQHQKKGSGKRPGKSVNNKKKTKNNK